MLKMFNTLSKPSPPAEFKSWGERQFGGKPPPDFNKFLKQVDKLSAESQKVVASSIKSADEKGGLLGALWELEKGTANTIQDGIEWIIRATTNNLKQLDRILRGQNAAHLQVPEDAGGPMGEPSAPLELLARTPPVKSPASNARLPVPLMPEPGVAAAKQPGETVMERPAVPGSAPGPLPPGPNTLMPGTAPMPPPPTMPGMPPMAQGMGLPHPDSSAATKAAKPKGAPKDPNSWSTRDWMEFGMRLMQSSEGGQRGRRGPSLMGALSEAGLGQLKSRDRRSAAAAAARFKRSEASAKAAAGLEERQIKRDQISVNKYKVRMDAENKMLMTSMDQTNKRTLAAIAQQGANTKALTAIAAATAKYKVEMDRIDLIPDEKERNRQAKEAIRIRGAMVDVVLRGLGIDPKSVRDEPVAGPAANPLGLNLPNRKK